MMTSAGPFLTSGSRTQVDPFVLLVDDHEPSLRVLQLVVEGAGYHCLASTSPHEALAFCGARRPRLVVTDLKMPRLDGRKFGESLKSRYPTVPLVLLTGETLDARTVESLRETFLAVLKKPLEVEPFLTLLTGLLPPSAPAP